MLSPTALTQATESAGPTSATSTITALLTVSSTTTLLLRLLTDIPSLEPINHVMMEIKCKEHSGHDQI